MKEKALKILDEFREKYKVISEAFDAYVKQITEYLEIPEDIAIRLVREELVNKYEKKLILSNLFSKMTLEELGLK